MPLGGFSLRITRLIICLGLIFFPLKSKSLQWSLLSWTYIVVLHIWWIYQMLFLWAVETFTSFSCTFVKFSYSCLTWYDFTSYSIVLPTSIYDWVFQPWCFFLALLFTSRIKLHIKVWPNWITALCSLMSCMFDNGVYSFCSWIMSNLAIVPIWVVTL